MRFELARSGLIQVSLSLICDRYVIPPRRCRRSEFVAQSDHRPLHKVIAGDSEHKRRDKAERSALKYPQRVALIEMTGKEKLLP